MIDYETANNLSREEFLREVYKEINAKRLLGIDCNHIFIKGKGYEGYIEINSDEDNEAEITERLSYERGLKIITTLKHSDHTNLSLATDDIVRINLTGSGRLKIGNNCNSQIVTINVSDVADIGFGGYKAEHTIGDVYIAYNGKVKHKVLESETHNKMIASVPAFKIYYKGEMLSKYSVPYKNDDGTIRDIMYKEGGYEVLYKLIKDINEDELAYNLYFSVESMLDIDVVRKDEVLDSALVSGSRYVKRLLTDTNLPKLIGV